MLRHEDADLRQNEYAVTGRTFTHAPSLMNALRYGSEARTEMSGRDLASVMTSSSSACSLLAMSARRLSSQKKYAMVVDEVSAPATLENRQYKETTSVRCSYR